MSGRCNKLLATIAHLVKSALKDLARPLVSTRAIGFCSFADVVEGGVLRIFMKTTAILNLIICENCKTGLVRRAGVLDDKKEMKLERMILERLVQNGPLGRRHNLWDGGCARRSRCAFVA